jgi:hypothetical protein
VTVAELRAELAKFSDHVEVRIVVPGDDPPETTFDLMPLAVEWRTVESVPAAATRGGACCAIRVESI